MSAAGRGRRAERGMTLLELLVATAIFGVLSVAIYPVVTGALASRAAATARLELDAEARSVLDRLEQDLAACVDTGARGQWPARLVAAVPAGRRDGARTLLELTTLVARGVTAVDGFLGGEEVLALARDRGDQAQVAWRIDEGGRLLRHERKPPHDEPIDWAREPFEVMSERATFSLEFWEPQAWYESWDSQVPGPRRNRAPLAVRTTLVVGAEGEAVVEVVSTVVLAPVEAATQPTPNRQPAASPGNRPAKGGGRK